MKRGTNKRVVPLDTPATPVQKSDETAIFASCHLCWLRGYRSNEQRTFDKAREDKHSLFHEFANSRFQTRQAADTWMCTRIYLFTYLYIVPYLYLCVISNVCVCVCVCVRSCRVRSVRAHHMHVYSTSILVVYNEFHSTRIASILIERTSQPSIFLSP